MIYDLSPGCPTCAEYEEPPTTTAFDWAKLFEGKSMIIFKLNGGKFLEVSYAKFAK